MMFLVVLQATAPVMFEVVKTFCQTICEDEML